MSTASIFTAQPVTVTDVAQMTRVNETTWPHEAASTEREPFTVTLDSGLKVIIWVPLSAAVELEETGYAILASSALDFAENLARAVAASGSGWNPWIECSRCTRHDRCGNHAQHGDGCHCLARDEFFRAYSPQGAEVLCGRHKHLAHSPAALVKLDIG